MTINVTWFDDNKRVIRWDVIGAWTHVEFYNAVSMTKNYIYQSEQAKYTIVDATKVTARPRGNLFQLFRSALAGVELDTVVYVNGKSRQRIIEMLVNMVFKTNRNLKVKQFRLAESVDDALELLDIQVHS